MTDNDSLRDVLVSLFVVCAVPIQCIIMWRAPELDMLDWFILLTLIVFGAAHIDQMKSRGTR